MSAPTSNLTTMSWIFVLFFLAVLVLTVVAVVKLPHLAYAALAPHGTLVASGGGAATAVGSVGGGVMMVRCLWPQYLDVIDRLSDDDVVRRSAVARAARRGRPTAAQPPTITSVPGKTAEPSQLTTTWEAMERQ